MREGPLSWAVEASLFAEGGRFENFPSCELEELTESAGDAVLDWLPVLGGLVVAMRV